VIKGSIPQQIFSPSFLTDFQKPKIMQF